MADEAEALACQADEKTRSFSFSHKHAARRLLPLPMSYVRRFVLWVYLSPVYSALQALVVLFYTVVLAMTQYEHEVFVGSYLTALLNSCASATDMRFLALANLTVGDGVESAVGFGGTSVLYNIWEWRQSLRSTPSTTWPVQYQVTEPQSAQCKAFLTTSLNAVHSLPYGSESLRLYLVGAGSIFFAFDALLAMVGAVGLQWHTQRNVFSTCLMSILNLGGFSLPHLFSVGVLRIFVTIYRTSKSFKLSGTVRVMAGLADAALGILPLSILLAGFIFFCAILGLQLFGGSDVSSLADVPAYPISNFASLGVNKWGYGALFTVIQILTGENWNEV